MTQLLFLRKQLLSVDIMILLLYRYVNIFRKRNAYYRFQKCAEVMKRLTAQRRQQQWKRRFRSQVMDGLTIVTFLFYKFVTVVC